MLTAEFSFLLDNPTRLPAAATPIDIDYRLQPEAPAVAEATKVSLAEVSLTLLDDRPIIFDEAAVCIEDSVGDDTILADGAVLTTNEVEEVLRDAFTEMDRFTPTTNTQEGTTSVSNFLISGLSGPSLSCVDIGYDLVCRGTSHSHIGKARPEGQDLRVFRRAAPSRINDQGNDYFHYKKTRLKRLDSGQS